MIIANSPTSAQKFYRNLLLTSKFTHNLSLRRPTFDDAVILFATNYSEILQTSLFNKRNDDLQVL